jgi:hypothetical protein
MEPIPGLYKRLKIRALYFPSGRSAPYISPLIITDKERIYERRIGHRSFLFFLFKGVAGFCRTSRGIICSIPRVPECLSCRRNWVPPPSPACECAFPLRPKGGKSNTLLRVRGWGDPFRTTGQKAWHSVYSVVEPFYIPVLCCAQTWVRSQHPQTQFNLRGGR